MRLFSNKKKKGTTILEKKQVVSVQEPSEEQERLGGLGHSWAQIPAPEAADPEHSPLSPLLLCEPSLSVPPLFTGMLNEMPWRWSACVAVTPPVLLCWEDSYGNRRQGQGSISQPEFGKRGCPCLMSLAGRLDGCEMPPPGYPSPSPQLLQEVAAHCTTRRLPSAGLCFAAPTFWVGNVGLNIYDLWV